MASRLHQIATLLEAQLGDATVKWSVGQLASVENTALRRIALIPVSADHTYTHGVGGQIVVGGGTPPVSTRQPAFLTRKIQCDVHIWDGTPPSGLTADRYDATEALLHDFLRVTREEAIGSVHYHGEKWRTQTVEGAGYAGAAELCILRVSFDVPVIFEAKTLTTIDHTGITVDIHHGHGGAHEHTETVTI
jgi:hypothetical protein